MCPSSRESSTGFSGVIESIQLRSGSGVPGQRSWSQSPPTIHSPGFRSETNPATRSMNSALALAGRRSTLASWNPPSTKCRCPSMKPGVTSASPLASTFVAGRTSLATSALSPTAEMVSPATARPPAQGRAESPVQTRP
jgi:hypothetical protein